MAAQQQQHTVAFGSSRGVGEEVGEEIYVCFEKSVASAAPFLMWSPHTAWSLMAISECPLFPRISRIACLTLCLGNWALPALASAAYNRSSRNIRHRVVHPTELRSSRSTKSAVALPPPRYVSLNLGLPFHPSPFSHLVPSCPLSTISVHLSSPIFVK